MNKLQLSALENPCRFAFQTLHPRHNVVMKEKNLSLTITINNGYE